MKKLNEQQQKAVDSNSPKILCLAGAGAGKTATMIERISRLVREGASPYSILVLTFTNAAGFEMRERYKQTHSNEIIPEFRTFHSFCYSLIIKDSVVRNQLGYSKIPKIAEESEVKRIETEVKMKCGINLSDAKLNEEVSLTTQEKYMVNLYKKALKQEIKKANIITFDVLCYNISQLFVDNHPCIEKYKQQYEYIFVDEFQDTDPKQIKFLNSFHDSKFYFCGDVLQNIYQFRGCSNETIKLLSKDDSWEKIRLFYNYRSTNQICDFANSMSTYADDSYRIGMLGQRDGSRVEVIYGAESTYTKCVDDDHMDMLMERINELPKGEDAAVLCRSNREVQYVCDVLTDHNISFSTGKRNVDALHILKCIKDDDYMLDWLATFLTAEKYSEYIRLAAQEENPNISWFAKVYGKIPKINERGKKIVEIRKILRDCNVSTFDKCLNILTVLEVSDILADITFKADTDEDILKYLTELIEVEQSSELYVGTIHSSKGLEYGTVFLMGVNDKAFPLKGEEMLNLYYVALTRAKNHLVVFRR